MAQNNIQPPSFVSESKTYAEYVDDLKRWCRLTKIEKKLQAEMVVLHLDGHPSRIKEKIVTKIGETLVDDEDGITKLITFLDTIYKKDDMADVFDKYKLFSAHHRKANEDVANFIPDWEMSYHKLKATGCEYSDSILGLKLLEDSQLCDMDTKLVLTGVNFAEAKTKKDLQVQVTNSLKKFAGRSVITSKQENLAVSVKSEPTYLVSQMEEVFLAKGWKPPNKGSRRRSRSASPPRTRPKSNYKGKKNRLGENSKPMKCYICQCTHVDNCNCPCVYHLADTCPDRRTRTDKKQDSNSNTNSMRKPDLGLFVSSNISTFLITEDDDQVFVISETLNNLVMLSVTHQEAVVDCACPTTVAGEKWVRDFVNNLNEHLKLFVKSIESDRVFKFGGGEKRMSKGVVIFPCSIGGRNIKLRTEVVDADFPLLLGNSFLKKVGAVLHIRDEKALILDAKVDMKEASSGHFTLSIGLPIDGVEFVKMGSDFQDNREAEEHIIDCLVASSNGLTYKDIAKLHQMFGHVSIRKLEKLISDANKLTDEVKGFLREVEQRCQSCKVHQKAKPRPAVSLPRTSKFNQIVTVDLKKYKDNNYNYILYLIDLFSRLTVGAFIQKKEPAIVGEMIMEKWVANFGRMEMIHSDRGGEFCCSELADIAEYIGVRSSFTAASSPNQNGVNERNHAVCDRMIDKMLTQDSSLSPQVALTWALTAKNSLENVSGFSPFQVVFGSAPSLPSVYTSGPPGYEEVVMEKAVADHINALFLGREAYIQCESDKILKTALKQRIYKRGEEIRAGDWIYYNNNGKWQGPVKVTTKDGKSLYVVRGGRLITINTDHAQLAMFEGEFVGQEENVDSTNVNNNNNSNNNNNNNNTNISSTAGVTDSIEHTNRTHSTEHTNTENAAAILNDSISQIEQDRETVISNNSTSISGGERTDIKKGNTVRYKAADSSEALEAKVLGRAGKKGGKYDQWWNLCNTETGHITAVDLGDVDILQNISNKNTSDENVYVVTIPRYRHHEQICKQAKVKELTSWDHYNVYEEVEDVGQTRVGTNWVLTEKIVDDGRTVKARLTIRGDQEESEGIRKDSPTVKKGNIKIFAVIASLEKWDIKTSDVASAFLQGMEIDRDVFVLPPKERRVPNVLWRLLKPVYGLVDAPRGWYLALDEEFLKAGCERCLLDPAMYLHFTQEGDEKKVAGMALTHVDDVLHGGSTDFDENVMGSVKSSFKFGLEERDAFRYVGMNMTQTETGILVDQDHYVKGLELPDMDIAKDLHVNDVLCSEGQTLFRGCVAKILHVGYQSRPDICFEGKCLSTKFGKATKGDLRTALKKMQKLQGVHTKMFFPRLGALNKLTFVGYGDAGIRSMPDKLSSVGGQVILLVDCSKRLACLLNWRSKKLVRKVVSSLAGEALAVVAAIGEMVYNKAILKQVYGGVIDEIPVVMFTDSRNLYKSVHSTSLVEDSWLIPDIAVIKDALCNGTISSLRRVSSDDMLANCLTKAGASAVQLMTVLQTGNFILPRGLDS